MKMCNLYSIGLFQNFEALPENGRPLLEFMQKFCSDVQNAGYIEVDDVNNLEFVFGEIADSISSETLRQLYIDQHLEYIASQDYKNDILPGYGHLLDPVLDDALSDHAVTGYNILDAVNYYAGLDFDLDAGDVYELLLAQLLYNEQNRNQIQELYNSNLYHVLSDILSTMVDHIDDEPAVKSRCEELLLTLNKHQFNTQLFQDTFSMMMDEFHDHFTPEKALASLSEYSFVAGLGLDAISAATSTVKDIVEYVSYGQAYINTSEDFRYVLFRYLVVSYYYVGADELTDRLGAWDSFINLSLWQDALKNFIIDLEAYRIDGAEAIAQYAKDAAIESTEKFAFSAVTEIAAECCETVLSFIPVLRWLPAIKDGLAMGQLLIEIMTNIDERAYSVDLLKKLYVMAYIMDFTVDELAAEVSEDDFASAAAFDEAVALYKAIISIAADYGAKYEEELLISENSKSLVYRSPKKASWYSTALSMMAVQKLLLEDIQCHSTGLMYNHHTKEITYDTEQLKIVAIACPVDVTIVNDLGEQIAFLGNNAYDITLGYEKYFFVCPMDDSSGDSIKIAIVPQDYEVLLDGTETGTMNAYIANLTAGVIEETAGFYDIPITEDSTGYFSESMENAELDDLVVDNQQYVGDTSEPGYNISGSVVSYGPDTDGITVALLDAHGEIMDSITVTGNNAAYSFGNVEPGRYMVEIRKKNHVTRSYELLIEEADVVQDCEIFLLGDANGDGLVNSIDAMMILQYYVGFLTASQLNCDAGDVDGDGLINSIDAMMILQYYVGFITSFPAE